MEIQVRTEFQHFWAELSEKLADVIDHRIKYGGGDELAQLVLLTTSASIRDIEEADRRIEALSVQIGTNKRYESMRPELDQLLKKQVVAKNHMKEVFDVAFANLKEVSGGSNALPD